MDYKLKEVVDMQLLQELQDRLYTIHSFPSAIIDNDGKVLTAVARQDICTKYHRVHPESEMECIKSDKYIMDHLSEDNQGVSYTCPRGMTNYATPIIIEGKQFGNFLTGQFFLIKPDLEFFKKQAAQFGFNENEYLKAVEKVPIWAMGKPALYLDFIKVFIEIIAGIGLKNLKEIEAKEGLSKTNKELLNSSSTAIKMMNNAIEAKKELEKINFKLLEEIEERKRVEEALKQSEKRLSDIIFNSADWVWEVDENGNYTYSSQKGTDYFGLSSESILGKTPFYFMPPEEADKVSAKFTGAVAQKVPIKDLENWNIDKNGNRICLLTNGIPILDEKGNLKGYRGVDKDITERKNTEEQLLRLHERITLAAKTAKIGIWDWDIINNNLIWDDKMYELYGCSKDAFAGAYDAWINRVYTEDKDLCNMAIENALKGEKDYDVEFRIVLPDDSLRYIKADGDVFRDDKGNAVRMLGVNLDITERKQAEYALKESEKRYKMLANNSSDVIWTMNLTGKFTYISPAIEKLRGYTVDEVMKQPYEDVISPGSSKSVLKKLQKIISSAKDGIVLNPDVSEIEQPCKNGSTVWTEIVTDLLRDEYGKAIGILGVSRNITERKKAQDGLRENEERYKKAQEVGHVGSWEYNIRDNTFWGSEEGKRIYGFDFVTDNFFADEVMNRVIEKDRVNQAMIDLIEKNIPYNIEFEIIPLNSFEKRTIHSIAELVRDENGYPVKVNGVLQDVTERKRIEKERKINIELLKIINAATSKQNLIESVVIYLKQWLNCDAIGIRLKEGSDYPYYETTGFPDRFIQLEKYLCSYGINGEVLKDNSGNPILDCMCGNIICGRFDIAKDFFTQHGSFWSNCTTELLATTTEADRQARTRNRCNGEGYESVGLFPLRFRGETFGLLQVNNKKKGLFTPELLGFLERIGDNLTIALSNHLSNELVQQSEEKYRKLFTEMMNGFALHEIVCDDEGNPIDYVTLDLNPAFELLLGVKREMVIGKKAGDILLQDELKRWLGIFGPVAISGKSTKYEMYSPVNHKYFEGIAYSPEPHKFAVVFYDITERREAEKELEVHRFHLEELVKERTDELNKVNSYLQREIEKDKEFEMMLQKSLEKEKELSELKSRFISTTSHEFRTPLTTLLLSTDLIKRYGGKWSDEKKNEHLDKIKNSVKYLTALLEDILTLNRAETGEISYKPEIIDFHHFSKVCFEDNKSLMNGTHILNYNYKSEERDFFLDVKLMRFVLNNLLSNAIKYSPNGGTIDFIVTVSKKFLKLEISDEGIGIPEDEIGKIFDSFYRSKNAEDMSGTGLGLAIVKRAVELHSGDISVSSKLGKGTTFVVRIPKVVK